MQNPPAQVGGFFIGCRQCRLVITGLVPVIPIGKVRRFKASGQAGP
ncbi:hypothetical protein J4G37_26930 [Microvirga sp. 3-52]|nr:hypothetical protein [Microvirga sp. 3-52]